MDLPSGSVGVSSLGFGLTMIMSSMVIVVIFELALLWMRMVVIWDCRSRGWTGNRCDGHRCCYCDRSRVVMVIAIMAVASSFVQGIVMVVFGDVLY